ncbi:MAG: hypothetical protein Q8P58_00830 [Candidatus Adlerbacteria bacterium]|nr:hypothetical protein [Candidatus Adlerbacteria bacterium]
MEEEGLRFELPLGYSDVMDDTNPDVRELHRALGEFTSIAFRTRVTSNDTIEVVMWRTGVPNGKGVRDIEDELGGPINSILRTSDGHHLQVLTFGPKGKVSHVLVGFLSQVQDSYRRLKR